MKNDKGEYYVVVPKGGGVYLTAELKYVGNIERKEENKPQDAGRVRHHEATTAVAADNTSANKARVYIEGLYENRILSSDVNAITSFSGDQQVAIVLTKLGMAEVMRIFGLRIKDLANKAAESIKSNLSSLVKTERLTIDGDMADWLVINVRTNGNLEKYCFHQLINGIWICKVISV